MTSLTSFALPPFGEQLGGRVPSAQIQIPAVMVRRCS
jgi:hypothetical protein